MHPLHDYVIIRVDDAESVSAGGIVIPDVAQKSQTGTVLGVGPGRVSAEGIRIRPDVAEGDTVIYSDDPRAMQKVTRNGEEYVVLQSSSVLAVIEK